MAGVTSQPHRVRRAKNSPFCPATVCAVVTAINPASKCKRRVIGALVTCRTAFVSDGNCEDVTGPVGGEQAVKHRTIGKDEKSAVRKIFIVTHGQHDLDPVQSGPAA